MDEITPTQPPIVVPPAPQPPAPADTPKEQWFSGKRAIGVVLSIALLVAIGTGAYLFYTKTQKKPKVSIVAPPAPPTPTSSPIRIPSTVATESAFLALVEEQASLSASLQAYQTQDPSLSPPVLDLPLGFSQ